MKGFWSVFIAAWAMLICFGCAPEPPPKQVNRAFYYWRNTFEITPTERQILDSLQINRIYLRLFDIAWNEEMAKPAPLEGVYFNHPPDTLREIVPVVYITQSALTHASTEQVNELATFLYHSIGGLQKRFGHVKIKEWQFDCDWTDGTKDKYFSLLQQVRDSLTGSDIQLSATIRLHQIKYQKRTGVPPVDRGVMMYYNIGRLADTAEVNSIYTDKTAANYMSGFDLYPLPLDVALPIFSWGVWFRNGKVEGLIHGLRQADIGTDFEKHPNYMRSTKDQYLKGFFIRQGDRIRLEEIDAEVAMQAAHRLSSQIKTSPVNVILYHLDVNTLNGFTPYEMEQIYRAFN